MFGIVMIVVSVWCCSCVFIVFMFRLWCGLVGSLIVFSFRLFSNGYRLKYEGVLILIVLLGCVIVCNVSCSVFIVLWVSISCFMLVCRFRCGLCCMICFSSCVVVFGCV